MSDQPKPLRTGWTTGACATAALKAALQGLWGGAIPDRVTITLPRGEKPEFAVVAPSMGPGWAEAGIVKDAGDDPDVTHGVTVMVRVEASGDNGVAFRVGAGVGIVTKPGLPVAVGEPAINPVPRQMMQAVAKSVAGDFSQDANIVVTISIPGGEAIALKTWNPRLGIKGGLSILGTTGIVRPFSCSAWIASIHRGIDVARASGLTHVAGCTGSTSEAAVRAHHGLPEQAMLDMGDFVGGMLKYLRRHPVERITIGGGPGKMAKLAQGAVDLHSGRSTVDFDQLASWVGDTRIRDANTVLEACQIAGDAVAEAIAPRARAAALQILNPTDPVELDVLIVGRDGKLLAGAGA